MNKKINKFLRSFSFLTIGKTQESADAIEFKKYIGLASSRVIAVNPSKQELENIFGNTQDKDPEYVVEGENGKEARITFIVQPDPEKYPDIDVKARAMITLRPTPAYNREQTKVQVIDRYGNHTWANVEDAKNGVKLLSQDGKELKIDTKYRMACVGECDLIDFLKAFLVVDDAFNYVNGSWVKKENADRDCLFALEHIKDYFSGDFSELREAIALQPNNKVKLLYGVRTTDDNKQYQAVATKGDLILRNSAGSNAITRLETRLADLKNNGSYPNTEFRVQELAEWSVEPTNLNESPATGANSASNSMPWD